MLTRYNFYAIKTHSTVNRYGTAKLHQGAAALLACYNPRGMAQLPEEGQPVQEYGPNIPAAVYTVFGGSSPTGKLPVSIPTLDDEYAPTDATLYERGFGLTYGG